MFSAIRKGFLFLTVLSASAAGLPLFGQGDGSAINSIRGTIFLPNGRALERSIRVELQSTSQPTQTDYSDINGTFLFASLYPGTYTVVVDAGELFEIAREYFQIDKEVEGRSIRIAPIPKTLRAPIYLMEKRTEALRNEVLNVKWSTIPRDAIRRFKRGLEFLQLGKDKDAEAEFRSAVAAAPNFSPAYTAIGNLEVKAGKLEPAVESFKKALRYDSSDFDATLNLGFALMNLRKYEEAEPALVTAAYINRTAVTPHYYLGVIYFMKRDLDIARRAFETARELPGGKTMPLLHRYLGQVYDAKKMNKEAVAEFEAYLSLTPKARDADGVRKAISEIKKRQN